MQAEFGGQEVFSLKNAILSAVNRVRKLAAVWKLCHTPSRTTLRKTTKADVSFSIKATFLLLLATLPFHEMPATVSEYRHLELEERKKVYQWDHVSDDLPGNIKAATHDHLPRDVQFSDEKSR